MEFAPIELPGTDDRPKISRPLAGALGETWRRNPRARALGYFQTPLARLTMSAPAALPTDDAALPTDDAVANGDGRPHLKAVDVPILT